MTHQGTEQSGVMSARDVALELKHAIIQPIRYYNISLATDILMQWQNQIRAERDAEWMKVMGDAIEKHTKPRNDWCFW